MSTKDTENPTSKVILTTNRPRPEEVYTSKSVDQITTPCTPEPFPLVTLLPVRYGVFRSDLAEGDQTTAALPDGLNDGVKDYPLPQGLDYTLRVIEEGCFYVRYETYDYGVLWCEYKVSRRQKYELEAVYQQLADWPKNLDEEKAREWLKQNNQKALFAKICLGNEFISLLDAKADTMAQISFAPVRWTAKQWFAHLNHVGPHEDMQEIPLTYRNVIASRTMPLSVENLNNYLFDWHLDQKATASSFILEQNEKQDVPPEMWRTIYSQTFDRTMEGFPASIRHSIGLLLPYDKGFSNLNDSTIERAQQAAKPERITPQVCVVDSPIFMAAELNALVRALDTEWIVERKADWEKLQTRQMVEMLKGAVSERAIGGEADKRAWRTVSKMPEFEALEDLSSFDAGGMSMEEAEEIAKKSILRNAILEQLRSDYRIDLPVDEPELIEILSDEAWAKYQKCYNGKTFSADDESYQTAHQQFATSTLDPLDKTLVQWFDSKVMEDFLATRFDGEDSWHSLAYVENLSLMLHDTSERKQVRDVLSKRLKYTGKKNDRSPYLFYGLVGNKRSLAEKLYQEMQKETDVEKQLNGGVNIFAQYFENPANTTFMDAAALYLGRLGGSLYEALRNPTPSKGAILAALRADQKLLTNVLIHLGKAVNGDEFVIVEVQSKMTLREMAKSVARKTTKWFQAPGGASLPRKPFLQITEAELGKRQWNNAVVVVNKRDLPGLGLGQLPGKNDMARRLTAMECDALLGGVVSLHENKLAGKIRQTTQFSEPAGGVIISTILISVVWMWTLREHSEDRVGLTAMMAVSASWLGAVLTPGADLLEQKVPNLTVKIGRRNAQIIPVYKIVRWTGYIAAVAAGLLGGWLYYCDSKESIADHESWLYKFSRAYAISLGAIPIIQIVYQVIVKKSLLSSRGNLYLALALVLLGILRELFTENDIQIFLRRILSYGNPKDLQPFADLFAQQESFEKFLSQEGE